jgi:hypothetical protein
VQGFVRRNSEVKLVQGKISTALFSLFSPEPSLELCLMGSNRIYVFICSPLRTSRHWSLA